MFSLRDVIISLLPRGAACTLDTSGDLHKVLDAIAENHQSLVDFLSQLSMLRDPMLTFILDDLEREYGLLKNTTWTDAERREYLRGIVYAPRNAGSYEYLQERLHASGFADVYVYPNSPAGDPGVIGGIGSGELITNTNYYDRTVAQASQNVNAWPFVFFLGGAVTRDEAGIITAVSRVNIAVNQRQLFRAIVLRYKPVHSWAIAIIHDARYFTFAPGDECVVDYDKGFSNDTQSTGGFWITDAAPVVPPSLKFTFSSSNVKENDESKGLADDLKNTGGYWESYP
jgi:hypothetical protein